MTSILAIDIGGSHIASRLVHADSGLPESGSGFRVATGPGISAFYFLDALSQLIARHRDSQPFRTILGVGVSVPGPFDYGSGVSHIRGVGKLESLFGLDLRQYICSCFGHLNPEAIRFINDAEAMLSGYIRMANMTGRVLGITLGTGFGSAFFEHGKVVRNGPGIPANGMLYDQLFEKGIADDQFSSRWFTGEYSRISGITVGGVRELTEIAGNDPGVEKIFQQFGRKLSSFLTPFLEEFGAKTLLIGGNMAKAGRLFMPALEAGLPSKKDKIKIAVVDDGEEAAMIGAAHALLESWFAGQGSSVPGRKTEQHLRPRRKPTVAAGSYDIYPAFHLPEGKILEGFENLAGTLSSHKTIIIDGYVGVSWTEFIRNLGKALHRTNVPVRFHSIDAALRPVAEILAMTRPSMGEEGSIFGRKYPGSLSDFFDLDKLKLIRPCGHDGLDILYGCGAALAGWEGLLVYADLPKNELQFRSRAGGVRNLGKVIPGDAKLQYKRFYFIDWVVLNRHKEKLLPRIDWLVDEQRMSEIAFMSGHDFRDALDTMSANYFRVRPWFEPGPWGGQWIRQHIEGLSEEVPNYAWSFELIVPENGLLLESSGLLLECSFDFLMFARSAEVLGHAHDAFGTEFPIRFDFLDTVDGGNLSVQCHPRPEYIKEQFGESFTQDETYYILDARDDATVFLGFREDIDPHTFRKALEDSHKKKKEVDIPRYVQVHPAKKHDLFLIPGGTIHASAKGNLVLEISSTPYIFTFKMYDWLRLDLDGKPRPLNIGHAMNNLCFDRKGERIKKEFISVPEIIEEGNGYRIVHLPTHPDHFYDVRRLEFEREINFGPSNRFYVCMLVEGEQVMVGTEHGREGLFSYAETFVVTAAAGGYQFMNKGNSPAKVVQAYVKDTIKL